MHRVFLNPELLLSIIERVATTCNPAEKQSLARLARTRKSISGAALDSLWKMLDLMDPLVSILPIKKVHAPNGYYGQIVPEFWSRCPPRV
jgi:hypothetical protein